MKSYTELGLMNSTDISFVSSDRPSTERSSFPSFYNDFDSTPRMSRLSNISDTTIEMMRAPPRMSMESELAGNPYSPFTRDREGGTSFSSPSAWNNNKSNMVIISS